MDRALVYSQGEIEELNNELRWVHNIPFSSVPRELVEQLKERPYSYEEYLERCNSLSNYWNFALVKGSDVLVFCWGFFDPLERLMHVVRLSIRPQLFRIDGKFLHFINNKLKEVGKSMGARKIYWITDKWKVFLRKLPNELTTANARIVEVCNV